jgi:hypothetical protein
MFSLIDIVKHQGHSIEVNGKKFDLYFDSDLSGDYAIWFTDDFRVYATPGWEGHAIAIALHGADNDVDYDVENYDSTVRDFEHYVEIVKEHTKKMLDRLPE